MWPRKLIDITWGDLASGLAKCLSGGRSDSYQRELENLWRDRDQVLACLSVRSGFDSLLQSLRLERNSEVLVSALTIPDMVHLCLGRLGDKREEQPLMNADQRP